MAKKQRKSQKSKPQQSNAAKAQSRRAILQYGAIGAALLVGGGYIGVRSVQASICEIDLTKVGNGTPAIVQIHDPNCAICATLQREARKAIKSMNGDQPEFLVANIKTLEGSTFAADHGVPHITILLFDGKGEMQQVIRGPHSRDQLKPIFENHMARYTRS